MADPFYAYTRSLNPATGDTKMGTAAWPAGSPLAEKVLRCLRTRRGSYLPDPTYGLDWSKLQHAQTNSAALLRASITDALSRFVRSGVLTDLAVTVAQTGNRLLFDVAFVDPRTKTRDAVTGSL